jgi:acetyl esterase/lipase
MIVVGLLPSNFAEGAEAKREPRFRDLVYATFNGIDLKLDLYLPQKTNARVVVYVHGGAWREGSKSEMPLGALVDQGYAVASVDYRLSRVVQFPAQVHDIKAAIRFLRGEGSRLGVDASRIAVAGSSAGGHLAALVGVSNRIKALEGTVGDYLPESSDVQAIVSLFGASNLQTILAQSTPYGLKVRVPALQLLLGGQPEDQPEITRLASPVFHVDATDPPLLLIHGDQDPQMPINQSHELQGAYEAAGLPVQFHVIHGAKHGGSEFYDKTRINLIREFLDKHLQPDPKNTSK